MRTIHVGVDPGKSGGIVAIDVQGIVTATPMPEHPVDLLPIMRLYQSAHWTIEKVAAIHLASAKSSFTFGYGAGILEGMLTALGIRFQLVPPKNWQKVICEGVPQDMAPKDRAYRVASRLYPGFVWPMVGKKPHDGIVDASLIAQYGFRGF